MFNNDTSRTLSKSHLRKQILFLMVLLSGSFLITTTIFWMFERGRNHIHHFGDVAWWWFVTSSTVGYGDLVPYTTPGRIAGVIAIIVGLFSYTHIIGIILQVIQHKFEEEERGQGSVNFKNHVIICEYTAFADELIQEIKERDLYLNHELVIVGSLVNRTPYSEYSFVYGEPISPDMLQRANISEAETIFVFSNHRFTEPDIKTLHVVSRIMRLNNHGSIYVELQDPDHPLRDELPRNITVMNSSDMLHKSIQHKYIDVEQYTG